MITSAELEAMLLQQNENSDLHPVGYASRILNSAECSYSLPILYYHFQSDLTQTVLVRETFPAKPLITLGKTQICRKLASSHIKW